LTFSRFSGHWIKRFGVSERFACRVLGQHRSTQRKIARTPDDEAALSADIIALAAQYGRYGYRRITALLRAAGWVVNVKRGRRVLSFATSELRAPFAPSSSRRSSISNAIPKP
jgi:hypothetical protein